MSPSLPNSTEEGEKVKRNLYFSVVIHTQANPRTCAGDFAGHGKVSLASPSAVTFSGRNPKDMDNIDKKPWQPSTEVLRNWWQFVVAGNQHFAAFIFLNLGLASLKASSFITTQLLLQRSEK